MQRVALAGALLALAASVLGCAPAEPETYPASIAPILTPNGTISSQDFLRLFVDDCLRPFPDQDAIGAAFLADGFTTSGRGPGANGVRSLIRLAGADPVIDGALHVQISSAGARPATPSAQPPERTVCNLFGALADPDRYALALYDLVDAEGEPLHWEEDGSVMRTSFSRGDATLYLTARLPALALRPYHADVANACGELPRCQTWGDAGIAVHSERDTPI